MKWNLVSMYLFYFFQNLRVNCNFLPKYGSFEATRAGVYAFTYAFLTEKSEAAMWVNTRTPLNFSPIPIPKDHFTILEPEDQEIGEFFMQFMNVVRQILKLLSCVSREILISCNRQANQDPKAVPQVGESRMDLSCKWLSKGFYWNAAIWGEKSSWPFFCFLTPFICKKFCITTIPNCKYIFKPPPYQYASNCFFFFSFFLFFLNISSFFDVEI